MQRAKHWPLDGCLRPNDVREHSTEEGRSSVRIDTNKIIVPTWMR